MCGFAGIFTTAATRRESLERDVSAMIAPIAHRGPDDSGLWSDPHAGCAVGFRRLSIVDLSEHGHQPMRSATGRYTLAFNGEVYNHARLRAELERDGARFRGHSDTETILASFERWGIRGSLPRFVGMFAMAVWDAEGRELTLIRDRLGIKPLFISSAPGLLTFGSELKALMAGPGFARTLDERAVPAYLRYLYVPAPETIFRNVVKLSPGHSLTIRDAAQALPASEPYWSVAEAAERGLADPFTGSDEEALERLEEVLSDAIRLRMLADVPLGALLSGGIDSSLVVAHMQAASSRPVRTYSIGFDVAEHDESPHARRVARHLGTDHTELMVSGEDALAVVPRLAEMFDEPFADPSAIPTFLVCELARRDVTVALSGDGGDELFAGYNRYVHGESMIGRVARIPRPVRRLVGAGIGEVGAGSWDRAYRMVAPVLPASLRHRLPGEKIHKLGKLMVSASAPEMYRSLLSAWQEPEGLMHGSGRARASTAAATFGGGGGARLMERMMLADQQRYLPDDLLAKLDRVSMAVSLEARVPLLDHRLVELSWRLPRRMKVRDGVGKWLLREALYRRVPRELLARPKVGFTVPLASWLRGPLRAWAADLLLGGATNRTPVLDPARLRSEWTAFLEGRDVSALGIWTLVMFRAWERQWGS